MVYTARTEVSDDCPSGYEKWSRLLGYLGSASYDENTILPEIALSVNEVLGKWNIITAELADNLQCGVTHYRIDENKLANKGQYVDDVIFVSAGGVCFTEADNECGYQCHTYKYDEDEGTITLSDAPMGDHVSELKVRVRLNMDVNESCCISTRFRRKYGAHIINYMLYKRALRTTDNERLSGTQIGLLYRDAVEYFEDNEWKPYTGINVRLSSANRVRLC